MSEAELSFDGLLELISEENPSGFDPRSSEASGLYFQIKEARNQARAKERLLGIEISEREVLEYWQPILTMAPELLSKYSKDLDVIAWFVEALLRKHDLSGLSAGMDLAKNMIDTFWETAYPTPDEDEGVEEKAASFMSLFGGQQEGTIIAPLRRIKITEAGTDSELAFWQYHLAYQISRISDPGQKQAKLDAGAMDMTQCQALIAQTPANFYQNLQGKLNNVITSIKDVDASLTEKCGMAAPSVSNVKDVLEELQSFVSMVLKDKGISNVDVDVEEDLQDSQDADGPGLALQNSSSVNSRENALNQLRKVAGFFRDTEPHSPISYTIEQLICWADLPLPELLKQLIPNEDARTQYFSLTGINKNVE